MNSDSETISNSGDDSCSTQTSSTEEPLLIQNERLDFHSPDFFIVVCSLAKIFGDKKSSQVIDSASLCYSTAALSGVLLLNRNLFRECWGVTPLAVLGEQIQYIYENVASHVSSNHVEVFFRMSSKRSRGGHATKHFRSMDIVDHAGNTFLNGVLLHPLHRYHYTADSAVWRRETDKISLILWASHHAAFKITLCQSPKFLRHRSLPQQREKAIYLEKILESKKKEVSRFFTSGIRLKEKDIIQIRKKGFEVNTNISKSEDTRLLVAGGPLVRSVKLLSILPHIETIVEHRWLKELMQRRNVIPPVENFHHSEINKKGSIEDENNFTLTSFLSIPVQERETFLRGYVFWVHPLAEPQRPPSNDLKSVIRQSGGRVTKVILEADIIIIPGGQPQKKQRLHLSLEAHRCLTERCTVASPDRLFKCILRHQIEDIRSEKLSEECFAQYFNS